MRIPLMPLLLFIAASAVVADEGLLPVPFQVEAVARDTYDRWGEPGAPGVWRVVVDLGSADGKPVPDADRMRQVTLIGSLGVATASVQEIAKVCEYLCGTEGETCHYVARVVASRPLSDIGNPLLAVPGAHEIQGLRPRGEREPAMPLALPAAWLSRDFETPAWPVDPDSGPQFRLRAAEAEDRELRIETRWPGGQIYPFDDLECRARTTGPLTELACSSMAAIVLDGRPLLVSFADYNEPAAQIVASFEHGGRTYHVVRLGLKAQTVHGLLVETPGGWRALVLPRDYAQIC